MQKGCRSIICIKYSTLQSKLDLSQFKPLVRGHLARGLCRARVLIQSAFHYILQPQVSLDSQIGPHSALETPLIDLSLV